MLVHICCSVDSHYFLTELKKIYDGKIVGYFYDPNIHPQSEYELRYLDVARSCKKLGIELIKGEYELGKWLDAVSGYEDEPERGARCSICFDVRMKSSVELAHKLGLKRLTTTLLTSPKKDINQLKASMQKECDPYGIEFFAPDFRSGGGTQRQFAIAKSSKLYHQNYCGCIYALSKQKGFAYELLSPVLNQVLPGSIEERISVYEKVAKYEEMGVEFDIKRLKFLNYRLLFALTRHNKKPVKSYVMFYSHFKNHYTSFSIDEQKGMYFCHKDEIVLVDFELANDFYGDRWGCFDDMFKTPLSIDEEKAFRHEVLGDYSLSPLVVVDKISGGKWEFSAKSDIYHDVREVVVRL